MALSSLSQKLMQRASGRLAEAFQVGPRTRLFALKQRSYIKQKVYVTAPILGFEPRNDFVHPAAADNRPAASIRCLLPL
jgi:hypothetical protein